MELVWDFARQLDPGAQPGSTVSYFDEMTQSFYTDTGQIKTQIGQLNLGQWQDLERDTEVAISDVGYSNLDIEHNFNGAVWGMAQHGSDVVLLMYEYMLDISTWIESGSWDLSPDNPIKLGEITVKNADKTRFCDDNHTLFAPGSKMQCRYALGDSEPEMFCVFFIEHSPYDNAASNFRFTGRNRLGFFLTNQTMDENTSYLGTKHDVITALLVNSGMSPVDFKVMENTDVVGEYVFDSAENYFKSINTALKLMDWYMDDLPDGTIVIGDAAYIKANAANTGIYTFDLGTDVISRSVSRQMDGVYSRVCVRRKGAVPTKSYAAVPYFEGWYIGANKTYYQDVPDTTDDDTINRIRDQLVEGMQFSGLTETFDCKFRPWLQMGDVAIVNENGVPRISGIITDIKHKWGISGFFTSITVTSGGTINDPDNPATVATKYAGNLGGANRQRRLTDYIISGTNSI